MTTTLLTVEAAPETVSTVDGETRAVTRTWPDGSWSCPFCGAANCPGMTRYWEGPCANPACLVGGGGTPENVARVRLQRQEEEERASQRAWLHAVQVEERALREDNRHAAVEAFAAEAAEHGYCIECWGRSTRWGMWLSQARITRHRQPENCPSVRRRRTS